MSIRRKYSRGLSTVGVLYGPRFARTVVCAWRDHHSSVRPFLAWFWRSKSLSVPGSVQLADVPLVRMVKVLLTAITVMGLCLIADWAYYGAVGGWAFGAALVIAAPIIVVHLFAAGMVLGRLGFRLMNGEIHPKRLAKALVASVLEHQVRVLRRRHRFVVVAVAGSVGKTSTKLAIAELLGQSVRVQYQAGNYNDRVTVPLVFFGQVQPALYNPFAWMRLFGENTARLHHPYPYDVVVVELGTDAPGQMHQFAYLRPDITVLTAVTPEHMEQFGSLDAVAAEELQVFNYSRHVLVNGDDTPGAYVAGRTFAEYTLRANLAHNYYAKAGKRSLGSQHLQIELPSGKLTARVAYSGDQGVKFALAAAAVADMLGVPAAQIAQGLTRLQPFAGRMQMLEGVEGSTLIDDTYNASPVAVQAALDVLYDQRAASQRIAILGSMNELGSYAREAHELVGARCDPAQLDLLVTVGQDARRWLAPAAKAKGCQVRSYDSPYEAGSYVRGIVQPGAVVLAKGSQNGVFTEESLKLLLAHPADARKLVRQSRQWLRIKARQFDV